MKKYLALIAVFILGASLSFVFCEINYGIKIAYSGMRHDMTTKNRDNLSSFILARNESTTDLETLNELFKGAHYRSWPLLDENWTQTEMGLLRIENEKIVEFCFTKISAENECIKSKEVGKN